MVEINIDGFYIAAIHPTENKIYQIDIHTNSRMLEASLQEINIDYLIDPESLINEYKNIRDCKVLIFFKYMTSKNFNGESYEWTEDVEIKDVVVMCKNYKQQWMRDLQLYFDGFTREELKKNNSMHEILDWEEFYDEDFIFNDRDSLDDEEYFEVFFD